MADWLNVSFGVLIPFIGTTLGSAMVFFLRKEISNQVEKTLLGFASGVMIAASVWSLIIPALEMAAEQGVVEWIPAATGFLLGVVFLLALDNLIPHLHNGSETDEGPKTNLSKAVRLTLAVTLHNIPEGMAVGVVFAGCISGNGAITMAGAFALSVGIAIQNFPEGAVISMPLKAAGQSKRKAFVMGTLSGVVEPIAAVITVLLTGFVTPVLPYLLSFAAGAMIYVVVEELIPDAHTGEHSNLSVIGVSFGFVLMMILDVALG